MSQAILKKQFKKKTMKSRMYSQKNKTDDDIELKMKSPMKFIKDKKQIRLKKNFGNKMKQFKLIKFEIKSRKNR